MKRKLFSIFLLSLIALMAGCTASHPHPPAVMATPADGTVEATSPTATVKVNGKIVAGPVDTNGEDAVINVSLPMPSVNIPAPTPSAKASDIGAAIWADAKTSFWLAVLVIGGLFAFLETINWFFAKTAFGVKVQAEEAKLEAVKIAWLAKVIAESLKLAGFTPALATPAPAPETKPAA